MNPFFGLMGGNTAGGGGLLEDGGTVGPSNTMAAPPGAGMSPSVRQSMIQQMGAQGNNGSALGALGAMVSGGMAGSFSQGGGWGDPNGGFAGIAKRLGNAFGGQQQPQGAPAPWTNPDTGAGGNGGIGSM